MFESLLNNNINFSVGDSWLFLIILWVLPWKGVALWRAVRNSHKKWFVVLLILNTVAILEILYIFYFSKPKTK